MSDEGNGPFARKLFEIKGSAFCLLLKAINDRLISIRVYRKVR